VTTKRGRIDAASRLRRLLAVVPWVLEHQGAPLSDVAARFGVTVAELEADFDLLQYCGLPPYSPDRLIDCQVTDGRVTLRFAEYFNRPISLTPAEGFTLLAAGQTLLAVPGADPDAALAAALAKLADALDAAGGVAVEFGAAPFVPAVRTAVEAGEQLEIDYYGAGRDARTTRRVDPYAVFARRGEWYLDAYCHLAEGDRLFRVDRIAALRTTGEIVKRPDDRPGAAGTVYQPSPDDQRVELLLPPEARWVTETYPTESVDTEADGRLRVVMAVSSPAWLERLLLRLGPTATVVGPDDLPGFRAAAARRVLSRYRGRS
jgi:proteasome accessory factor C